MEHKLIVLHTASFYAAIPHKPLEASLAYPKLISNSTDRCSSFVLIHHAGDVFVGQSISDTPRTLLELVCAN